ncbi:hypothetical protein [Undibacterium umbellatum]|uniref:LPS export ABC transporter periplasmic protein LptC n=1 Tax=Undibacterium umbellatum TaxID=2762300 RepID=A0ABR6ZGN4_9BURK|nr:hypothetical protein [Undibacterium umbellatum]MBC3910736.1 hypothetical protein [Undibacterium umbellatum]
MDFFEGRPATVFLSSFCQLMITLPISLRLMKFYFHLLELISLWPMKCVHLLSTTYKENFMRLIPKFALVAVTVAGIALLFRLFSSNNELDAVGNTPANETLVYAKQVEDAEKKPDVKIWPGTFVNSVESRQQVLEYKMNLAENRSFQFSISSYAAKKDRSKAKPDVSKQLSGHYRVKGNVIYFENLQGDTGLMSDKARSVVNGWGPDGIEFNNENSVMRLRAQVVSPSHQQ